MSIMTTVFPAKVKFQGTKIDVHKGEDITPVLNQTGYQEIRLKERFRTSKHTCILNVPAGFDIETTSGEKGAYMYKWQMVFGEYLISGRTWDEWMYVMEAIQKAYNFRTEVVPISKKKTVTYVHTFILWIANQGYEYQFFCKRNWNGANIVCIDPKSDTSDVFADGMRRPLKTMLSFTGDSEGAITVYDALKFSTSLAQLAKDYGITKKKKKTLEDGTVVSDLDYSIPRNSHTPLNDEEEEYCDADVEILYEWACFYLNAYLEQNGIAPMTSTGIIRHAVVENYDAMVKDHRKVMNLHPQFDEYIRAVTQLYRGGFTYANRAKAGKELEHVVGKDFTSSYPAVMLQEKFPSTPFMTKSIKDVSELDQLADKAWYADFEFEDLIIKEGVSVESLFKCHEWDGNPARTKKATGCVVDNGKIAYAKHITVTLCEYDWDTYNKFYEWGNVKVSKLMVADKDYLPDWFTMIIKYYYKQKDFLKNNGQKGTTAYALAKAIVNGLYGLTVQKVHFDSVIFDEFGGWSVKRLNYKHQEDRAQMKEKYDKAIGRDWYSRKAHKGVPKVVLSPYWGIWCTAIARNRILNAIHSLGEDFVYCDTDSVYYQNADDHQDFFDTWNKDVHDWNDANLVDKEFHTLGDFDPVELDDNDAPDVYEYSFMSLGAKRYIKFTEDKLHATIAGLPHGSLQRRAKKEVGDDPKKQVEWMKAHFKDGMKIAAEEALKNAHDYVDEATDEAITDPYGYTEIMHEESSILIHPIEFTLKLDPEYAEYIGKSTEEFLLMYAYKMIAKEDARI